MSTYKIHTKDSAPRAAAPLLSDAEKAYGFVPNLLGVLATSPATLKAYMALGRIFEESSFSPVERQLLLLTVSRFNECGYCMAAHTVIAGMHDVPQDVIEAMRNDQPITDERLEALRRFTALTLRKRGWVTDRDISAFTSAGFDPAQVLEVVLAISFKTISNYVNHFAKTPLDTAFSSQAWQPRAQQIA
jgi:uncharacterized peroxidase-related enzyme